jgi:branched-chain amino acid transport system substrate-binding protein
MKIKKMKKLSIVAVGVILIIVSICSTNLGTFAAEKKSPITIGLIFPMTGAAARTGLECWRSVQLAVKQINETGGVLGRPLKVILEDNESRPKAAVDAAHKLVEVNKVPVIIGGYMSSNALPVGEYLNSVRIPFITTATTEKLRYIGPYVFNVACTASQQLSLVDFAVEDLGAKKIASLTQNNPIGQDRARYSKKYIEEILGGKQINTVLYDVGKKDYRVEIMRTMEGNPDVILCDIYAKDARIIFKQAYEMGYTDEPEERAKFYHYAIGSLLASGLKEPIEGMKGQDYGAAGFGGRGPDFVEAFTTMFGEKPINIWANAFYDATWILAIAINMAQSTEPDAIRDALYPAGYIYMGIGDMGDKAFDIYGMQARVAFQNVHIVNGETVPYEKPGVPKVVQFSHPGEMGKIRFTAPTQEDLERIYKK